MIQGHCFCGFVHYQADGPLSNETLCHCSICRRASGAPVVAWVTVTRARFRIVSGTPTSFRSSDHGTRSFCPRCGTALTFQSARLPDEIDVTVCSLDDPAAVAPRDHTWVSSRLPWMRTADGLPTFPEARTPGPDGS